VSEDLLSSSDTCDAIYEDQDDIGSKALDASHVCNDHHHDPEIPKGTSEPHQQAMDEHSVPNLHQPRGHTSADSIEIYQANIMPSSELTEEHCKKSSTLRQMSSEGVRHSYLLIMMAQTLMKGSTVKA